MELIIAGLMLGLELLLGGVNNCWVNARPRTPPRWS